LTRRTSALGADGRAARALFLLNRPMSAPTTHRHGHGNLERTFGRGDMNDITDRSIMAALGRQLTIAVAKQSVAAGNLANLDTPGYKTRGVTFDDVLAQQVQSGAALAVTRPGHLAGAAGDTVAPEVRDVDGLQTRRDGNNVELDRELLSMSRASTDFTAAQTALSAKFRLVRYAIAESK
jgi:flagellar basal-body rod protein FlgB